MAYKVKLDVFEGPFELLVYLIEHSRMSIYDIQVSEITTQYLAYVEEMRSRDVELAQEFMVLAAELLELKSRLLIPGEAKKAEEGGEDDPRSSLTARILEYKQFKDMAAFLDEQQEITAHIHSKPQEDLSPWTGEEDELLKSSEDQFVNAFLAFLQRRQRIDEMKRTYQRVERQRQSMESRMSQITDMLQTRRQMMFSEMIREDTSVYNRVLTFMSLLELVKDHRLNAEQKKLYSDIKLTLREAEDD